MLNLSGVGDDLLHDLHGLALGLSCLPLTLGCSSLDNLYLLALTHLHGHWSALTETKKNRMSTGGKLMINTKHQVGGSLIMRGGLVDRKSVV